MEIKQFLSLDCTQCAVEGSSKKRILESISHIAAQHSEKLDQPHILHALACRERLGSTGIGNGIALPHGRIKGLEKVVAVFITASQPIEFDAIDDNPVDIFFAILVPEEQTQEHLQILATIAQKLSDKDTIKAIRAADNPEALFAVITGK